MDISAALSADLRSLNEALDAPEADLEDLLSALVQSTRLAIGSCLGLTMILFVEGFPLSMSVLTESAAPDDIRTSVFVPLPALRETDPDAVIVFYASAPGAFVDLAADLSVALRLQPGAIVLDEHLQPPNEVSGLAGLDDLAAVNQAVGLFIGAGHTPESAHTELDRIAESSGTPKHEVAQRMIREAVRP